MPSSGVDTHTKVGPTPLVQGLSDKNCVKWEQSVDGETCETFEKRHGVKKEDLERWNGLDCESEEGLWEGYHVSIPDWCFGRVWLILVCVVVCQGKE